MASEGKNVMVQGRIVWCSGDLFKGQVQKIFGTQQVQLNKNTGEPQIQYGFGLAVPKSVLGEAGPGQPGEIWSAMHEEAYKIYPSRQLPPAFSMKYKDGDGIDHNGQPFSAREGYAGHIVLSCTTSLPIKFFRYDAEARQNIQISEGIKCGDYVNVQLSVKGHPAVGQGKPGLYLNPNAVQFLGYGKEIINAPSGDQIFGQVAPPVPMGASATPVAPAGMLVPTPGGFGQPPVPQQQPQGMQSTYQQPMVPQQPAPAHYGVLPQAYQQPGPAPMPQAPQYQQPQSPQGVPMPPGFPNVPR